MVVVVETVTLCAVVTRGGAAGSEWERFELELELETFMGRAESVASCDGAGFAIATAAVCDAFLSEDSGV